MKQNQEQTTSNSTAMSADTIPSSAVKKTTPVVMKSLLGAYMSSSDEEDSED